MKSLFLPVVTFGVLSLACGAPPLECDDDEEEVDGECVKEDDPFSDGDADTDSDSDSDSDSDTDADTDADPSDITLQVYYEAFGADTIRWNTAGDSTIDSLTLYVIDNGDVNFTPGCDIEQFGGLACDVWTEQHNGWDLTDEENSLGGSSHALILDNADSPDSVITNATTLFTTEYMATGNATWMVYVTGSAGFGCMTGGYNRAFFSDYCQD